MLRERVRKNSLTREDVIEALEEASVPVNDQVEKRIKTFLDIVNKSGTCETAQLIAEAIPPQDAQDEALVFVSALQEQADAWQDDAAVNCYPANAVVNVQQGDMIGTISPPQEAKSGMDVTGQEVAGKGSPATLKLDHTLQRNAETNEVTACASGMVVVHGGSLSIEPRTCISGSINIETGAVKTGEHLLVQDRIIDGMSCTARGSITVGGAIEAARVYTGSDLFVRKGIIGRKCGLIQSDGSITAKYMTDANVVCQQDLIVVSQLMNSYVCVDGFVEATNASIIGGATYSHMGIRVNTLGSSANIRTRLIVGVEASDIRRIAEIDRRAVKIQDLMKRIRFAIDSVTAQGNKSTTQQHNLAHELEAKIQSSQEQLEKDNVLRGELMDNINTTEPAFVEIYDQIFPNVTIRIGDRTTTISEEMKGPVRIEKQKVRHVTEVVAINLKIDRVTVLTSERDKTGELLDGYQLEQAASALNAD